MRQKSIIIRGKLSKGLDLAPLNANLESGWRFVSATPVSSTFSGTGGTNTLEGWVAFLVVLEAP